MTSSVPVLIPQNVPGVFDYAVPEGMNVASGSLVSVPLGTRKAVGVVWGEAREYRGNRTLKSIEAVHDHLPPFSETLRKWIDWVAWYNCAPAGTVLKMALPVEEALKPPNKRERNLLSTDVAAPIPARLAEVQQRAAEKLKQKIDSGFSVTVLDGITGSGKTEVYFEAMKAAEGQILVLLPEISLSVQWLERFKQRFGFAPHVWHSGLPAGVRKHTWRAIAKGEARVVVGARSALFLPYSNLKMIVVDEEHENSYKQEDGVHYQARDMAVARARFEKIPLTLVSATPSLESYANVKAGKYEAIHLHERHAGALLPEVKMIDMRSAKLERGAFIAEPLRKALAENLARGQQSLLFLNRRGYAPLTLCRSCGHRFQCPQCSAWLVMHKRSSSEAIAHLQCHHCGYCIPQPKQCVECKAENSLHACGPGVERVAEEVSQILPQARVSVLASDNTESFAELAKQIHAIEAREIDIIVGTQMVAKGHHFEGLTLVGVVDADLGLGGGDLRAAERTYQLLHQLSGRAGRGVDAGTVMLQSFAPTHPVMQALIDSKRDHFMQLELSERERAGMPPFGRLAALIVEGTKENEVESSARALARSAPKLEHVKVLGPAPAPLYMPRGRYRQRLLVKAPRNIDLSTVMKNWVDATPAPRTVRVKVDVDPYSFL